MEDFDFIDALAKQALSDNTATPSENGWLRLQHKIMRKKRRRIFAYMFLTALLLLSGIFAVIHSNENDKEAADIISAEKEQLSNITNKKHPKKNQNIQPETTNAVQDHNSNTENKKPQTTTTTAGNATITANGSQKQSATQKNTYQKETLLLSENTRKEVFVNHETLDTLENLGVKLYDFGLIPPETLKKKRKKQAAKKSNLAYENFDLMIGLNGFTDANNYQFFKSYVVEVSYTDEKKWKNNYVFNYGFSLQFRNLHFEDDSVSFNRGELSLNVLSSIEKRFGNFGVEVGAYAGYEFYSPNNDVFNNNSSTFFEEKINYGLFSGLHYKKIGLIFKYEFSPYITYLGTKKFGAFTVGVKYDF